MTGSGLTVLLIAVAASAVSDLCVGKIYNFIVMPALAGGILLRILEAPRDLPIVLTGIIMTYLLLLPFWKMGGLGAGDIKLLAAILPYMGIGWYCTCFVLSIAIAAVISIILLFSYRDFTRRIHMAVPIGISVMLCLLLQQFITQSPIQFYL